MGDPNKPKVAPQAGPQEGASQTPDVPPPPIEPIPLGAAAVAGAASRLERVAPKPNFEKLFPKATAQTMSDDQLDKFRGAKDDFWKTKITSLEELKGNLRAAVDPKKVKSVLNLRDDSGKITDKLAPNTEVILTTLEYKKAGGVDFVKVEAGGKKGWVALQYLKPDPVKSKEAVAAKVDADEKALAATAAAAKEAEKRPEFTAVALQEVRGYAAGNNLRPTQPDRFEKGTDDLEKLAINQIVVLDADVQGNDPDGEKVVIRDGTPVQVAGINKDLKQDLLVRDSIGNTARVSVNDVDAASEADVQKFAQAALKQDQGVWDRNLATDKFEASRRVLTTTLDNITLRDTKGQQIAIPGGKRVEIYQRPGATYFSILIGKSGDSDRAAYDVNQEQLVGYMGLDEQFSKSDNIVKIKKAVIISRRGKQTGVEWNQGDTKSGETVAVLGTLNKRVLVRTADGREGFIGRDAIDENTLMARKDLEQFKGDYDKALAARKEPAAAVAG